MTYDYGGSIVHPYTGRIVLKKLAGSGAITVGTQIVIPHGAAMPRNNNNYSYYTGVNSDAFVSGYNQGKKTPSVTITTLMPLVTGAASFITANSVNSYIVTTDSEGNTDTWSILLDDGYNPLVYDGCKCAQMQFRQQAVGGPVAISMAWLAQYGDSQNPGTLYSLTTFTSTSLVAGAITDTTQVSFASTADLVQSWALDVSRPQGYVFYDDGTRWCAGIASGMFGGDLTLSQSTKFTENPSSAATIALGTTGAGISISLLLLQNEQWQDLTIAPRTIQSQYSLFDQTSGGNPFVVTAL